MSVCWNNAEPFVSTEFGSRLYQKYDVLGSTPTFCYAKPPTEEQQRALMALPVVACSACAPEKQADNRCHVKWLMNGLQAKFGLDHCPEVISSKIPAEVVEQARKTKDWSHASAIHKRAYVQRGAVLLMRKGHPRGVPKLLPGMTSGASLFGNPFLKVPETLNCALYKRYLAKGFEPLTQEEVDGVVKAWQAELVV